jgi:hypothetical protein
VAGSAAFRPLCSCLQQRRFNQEGEFVVGGFVRAGNPLSSLIVGDFRRKNKDLYYVKRDAEGFTRPLRGRVFEELSVDAKSNSSSALDTGPFAMPYLGDCWKNSAKPSKYDGQHTM